MSLYYRLQRHKAFYAHEGLCAVCGKPITGQGATHHLLIPKGHLRDRDRAGELDRWINLAPCHPDCHAEVAHGGGREALCMRQYEVLGDGDLAEGYRIAYDWCETVLQKTKPDLPRPNNDSWRT